LGALAGFVGCQTPDELLPPVAHAGINSVTAAFADGSAEFTVVLAEGQHDVVIPIPYYYPEESDNRVNDAMLSKMRMRASLDDNVFIDPPLLFLDLSPGNVHSMTVTNQRKVQQTYTIRSDIRKSSACAITEFIVPATGNDVVAGIITETTKTVSLISLETLAPSTASVRISAHATISPDPRTTTIDYNRDQTFVVTAHDGTAATYTVTKSLPGKRAKGVRPGSEKRLFAITVSSLGTASGIAVANNVNGIAATREHVVLSTRANSSIIIDALTGAYVGTVDVSATGGGLNNFYTTADDDGNILICNLVNNRTSGAFKVYKQTSATAAPELFISCTLPGDGGRKLSIQGSVDRNAIITVPFKNLTEADKFARWTVVNGALTSQNPDVVTVSGIHWYNGSNNNVYNVDLVHTSATDVNADYFVGRYGSGDQMRPNPIAGQSSIYSMLDWMNGATGGLRTSLVDVNGNFVVNAVDYIVFNNAPYALVNYVNAYNWGQADRVYLVNTEGAFEAEFSAYGGPGAGGSIEWACLINTYGAQAAGTTNANSSGDVAFVESADGMFLYIYFMFQNGFVVGYQFDTYDI
jgi:hypothetical protein